MAVCVLGGFASESITIAEPPGVTADSRLIVVANAQTGFGAPAIPALTTPTAGWSAVGGTDIHNLLKAGEGNTSGFRMRVFESDGAAATFPFEVEALGDIVVWSVGIVVLGNADLGAPLIVGAPAGALGGALGDPAVLNAPGVNAGAGDLLLYLMCAQQGDFASGPVVPGMAVAQACVSPLGSSGFQMATESLVAAGATGDRTATIPSLVSPTTTTTSGLLIAVPAA